MSAAPDTIDIAAWLDTVPRLTGLPIPETYREGVLMNLRIIAIHTKLLGDVALDDHIEPAPVYRA